MGTSTDAYLVFGVPLPEGFVEQYDEDKSNPAANALGYMAFMGSAEGGVRLVSHCSSDYPEYIAAPQDGSALHWAWRGNPVAIASIDVSPEWEGTLRAFCEKHSIPWQQPQWWLASDWS